MPPIHLILVCIMTLCLAGTGMQARGASQRLYHEESTLVINLSDEFSKDMHLVLSEWLDHISSALLQVYGHWPRERWIIEVTPVAAESSNLIPWAQVNREEVNRVEFYTAREATAEGLNHSWTGYHELSHLLIPYRGWGDMWFSEGLASYYQNVLQVRAGVLTEQQMWQKLYDGFMRGRAQTEFDGTDLQSISASMRQRGAYMRVYWSGAWYFLTADTWLRQQSRGERSLDQALSALNHCCANQKMSVLEMVRKLDELNGLALFYPLYLKAIDSTRVPAFEQLFRSLGISIDAKQRVHLQNVGPGAKLRSDISRSKAL